MRNQTALLDFAPLERQRVTSKALVPISRVHCPACGGQLDERTIGEQALFRHGGYGATRTSVIAWCDCGWTIVRAVTETHPRPDRQ